MCTVEKDYGWMYYMHIHNLNTDRGFKYKYVETIQLDGVDVNVPLVDNGFDAYQQNYDIVDSLIKSRIKNYEDINDKHVRGKVSNLKYENGILNYSVESEKGSSIILDVISDIVKSGLLRLSERNFIRKEQGWKINVEFEIFPDE